jgi:hypothetical protein
MGLRFRKRIKVAPGIHINLSGSGISFNLGVPGLNVSLGSQPSVNLGVPGTGISYRHSLNDKRDSSTRRNEANRYDSVYEKSQIPEDNIISVSPALIDSGSLQVVSHLFKEVIKNAKILNAEYLEALKEEKKWKRLDIFLKILLIGFLPPISPAVKQKITDVSDRMNEIYEDEKNNYLDLDYFVEEEFREKFASVTQSFQSLQSSSKIWDINTNSSIDRISKRSYAGSEVRRTNTKIEISDIRYVKSNFSPLKFCNTNGADIYLYPSFAVFYYSVEDKFAAIRYSELHVTFMKINFCEEGVVPDDAVRVGETWKKVNKDGSRDKRFRDNYLIPIVQYGQIGFEHRAGISEVFQFSNAEAASHFYSEFIDYQNRVECVE